MSAPSSSTRNSPDLEATQVSIDGRKWINRTGDFRTLAYYSTLVLDQEDGGAACAYVSRTGMGWQWKWVVISLLETPSRPGTCKWCLCSILLGSSIPFWTWHSNVCGGLSLSHAHVVLQIHYQLSPINQRISIHRDSIHSDWFGE